MDDKFSNRGSEFFFKKADKIWTLSDKFFKGADKERVLPFHFSKGSDQGEGGGGGGRDKVKAVHCVVVSG